MYMYMYMYHCQIKGVELCGRLVETFQYVVIIIMYMCTLHYHMYSMCCRDNLHGQLCSTKCSIYVEC